MRIPLYLSSTRDLALTYDGEHRLKLVGYYDSDYVADPFYRKSVYGNIFLLTGVAVAWASKKQRSVATSTTEA